MAEPTHQVLILDVNPVAWSRTHHVSCDGKAGGALSFREFLDVMSIFAKSHIMLNKENSVQILAVHSAGCDVLYPPIAEQCDDVDIMSLPTLVESVLLSHGTANLCFPGNSDGANIPFLAQALSRALCAINRRELLLERSARNSKILVAQISCDAPSSYNAIMNTIFSAQKFGVPVDALVLSAEDSSFLQQACLLTGGVYLRPPLGSSAGGGALQLLLTHCLPCPAARRVLRSPLQSSVDFRASCCCHGRPADFTFLCSVCLSLFCPPGAGAAQLDKCEVCGTKIRWQ